jgi:hypothetical protein
MLEAVGSKFRGIPGTLTVSTRTLLRSHRNVRAERPLPRKDVGEEGGEETASLAKIIIAIGRYAIRRAQQTCSFFSC